MDVVYPRRSEPYLESRDNDATNREGVHRMGAVLMVEEEVSSPTVTNCRRFGSGGTDTGTHHGRFRLG